MVQFEKLDPDLSQFTPPSSISLELPRVAAMHPHHHPHLVVRGKETELALPRCEGITPLRHEISVQVDYRAAFLGFCPWERIRGPQAMGSW